MSDYRRYQITVDCRDPDLLARFWADVLGYELEHPPAGHATWRDYWISVGIPPEEAGNGGFDSIVDPAGARPRIWFQQVPEAKAGKNRFHFDVLIGGGRAVPIEERRIRVEREAARLEGLGATRRVVGDGEAHFFIGMSDPEGNEFDLV